MLLLIIFLTLQASFHQWNMYQKIKDVQMKCIVNFFGDSLHKTKLKEPLVISIICKRNLFPYIII